VTVASGSSEKLTVNLEPLDEALAHLSIATNVSDASIIVNGSVIGTTPLPSSLGFRPGQHQIRLERPGYTPAERSVNLQPGSEGSVSLPLTIDPQAARSAVGHLKLHISETNAVVLLDGVPTIATDGGLRLPVGRHHLVVRRDGFYDLERDVIVGSDTRLNVDLLPQPDYLRNYADAAHAARLWAWVATGVSVVAVGSSVGFLAWNQGEKDDAKRAFDEQAEIAESEPSGACGDDTCARLLELRLDKLIETRDRDVWGYVALGAGAAALGTGIVLFATGDDPDRYTPKPQSDVFGGLNVRVGLGGAFLRGAF
jgi:hypothetical protein